MNPKTDASESSSSPKPVLSLFFATAGGAGYIPKAPGTWGSAVGVLVFWLASRNALVSFAETRSSIRELIPSVVAVVLGLALALGGVLVADRVAKYSAKQDPQFVVIDEVSGQFFTYLFALVPASWKYLLLGFILFRVFDIWKPFPVRQAESLRGGWGIMADDWMAAVYAAIGIWIARAMGL
ncbi:MAG TPA: phosphatidylglycerophosphatase A [Candidatus Acidoferrales bacterium]|nr:phosphatidylglycerophosphatase A [Candidatus Acidoferrales bacterium]